jgi:hypothetical protein
MCVPDTLVDDRTFQALKSFRPFLGNRGNDFLTTLESLQELIISEPAQKTFQSLRLFGIGEKFDTMEVVSEAEPNAFNLFLILILLILADIPWPGGQHAVTNAMESVIPIQFV